MGSAPSMEPTGRRTAPGAERLVAGRDYYYDSAKRVGKIEPEVPRARRGRPTSQVAASKTTVAGADEPAPAGEPGGGAEEVIVPEVVSSYANEMKRAGRGGSGGGGSRGGSGAGGGRALAIDRAFNQDDVIGVLLVLSLLLLTLLYFAGGNAGQAPQKILQLASAEPAAAPPLAPPTDPFGSQPVDLTPKLPIPAVAPAPACPSGQTMRAWFCTDRADLTDAAKASLEKNLADRNACLEDKELVVTGYADTRGPAVYNTYLGGKRASEVANYLKAKGIKVAGLKGIGELDGLTDNENCSNQRRVDIHLAGEPDDPNRACAPPQEVADLVCS